jgi:hypothetical protein
MPNWCENTILIQGDPAVMEDLMNTLEEGGNPFSFNKVIKMPDALEGTSAPERNEEVKKRNVELYGSADWYDWASTNWGTKWNSSDTHITDDNTDLRLPGYRTVRIQFNTAWAPPFPVYDMLAVRFPNTNIYICYDEPGCDFSGYRMYSDGKVVQEREDSSFSSMATFYQPDANDIFSYFPEKSKEESNA